MKEESHGQNGHRLRRCLTALPALLIALSTGSLALRPHDRLPEYPLTEDAYYSLAVARNIALGNGVTADGASLTNGFQPLFTFLCVPGFVAVKGDRYLALRYVLLVSLLLYVATGCLVAAAVRGLAETMAPEEQRKVFWTVVVLYIGSITAFVNHFNGLETGALLFCYALAWRYYQIGPMEALRGMAWLGGILGLAVLARIDALLLAATLAVVVIVSGEKFSVRIRLLRAVILMTATLAVSSPWWLYNRIWFGSFIPTSGRITELWAVSPDRVKWALFVVLRSVFPVHPASLAWIGDAARFIALAAAATLLVHYMRNAQSSATPAPFRRTVEFGIGYGLFLLVLVVAYTSYSGAAYFYGRYFAPVIVFSSICLGYVFVRLYRRVGLITPVATSLLAGAMISYVSLIHLGEITSQMGRSISFNEQYRLVVEHTPEQDHVAASQSGTLGYFRDRVVNLDGKVNFEAFKLRGRNEEVRRYLAEKGVKWFCDQGHAALGDDPAANGWRFVAKKGTFSLYRYSGP